MTISTAVNRASSGDAGLFTMRIGLSAGATGSPPAGYALLRGQTAPASYAALRGQTSTGVYVNLLGKVA